MCVRTNMCMPLYPPHDHETSTLQHTSTLQQDTATGHCNSTLQQNTATANCNSTLQQHTATEHCNSKLEQHTATAHGNSTLQQHTAIAHCNSTLQQHTAAAYCNSTLQQYTATQNIPVLSVPATQYRAAESNFRKNVRKGIRALTAAPTVNQRQVRRWFVCKVGLKNGGDVGRDLLCAEFASFEMRCGVCEPHLPLHARASVCVCACVCVYVRVCAYVCVYVCERETDVRCVYCV